MKFLNWLENKFIGQNVYGEIPITKDNCEDLFDRYTSELDIDEWMVWANLYGAERYLEGKKDLLKELSVDKKILDKGSYPK